MMPEAREQLVGGKTQEEIFDEIDEVAKHFATDPLTTRGIVVESLPLVIDSKESDSSLVISFRDFAEYSGTDTYRLASAEVHANLIGGSRSSTVSLEGADWDVDSLSRGEGAFQSIRETGMPNEGPTKIIRRDEERKGRFNLLGSPLLEEVLDMDIPGTQRLGRILAEISESKTKYNSAMRSPSQSRDDFKMVRNFIRNVGIGKISTFNQVPVLPPLSPESEIIEIEQTRYFELRKPWPTLNWDNEISSEVSLSFESGPDYEQKRKHDQKFMEITGIDEMQEVVGALRLSTKEVADPDFLNIPLSRDHISRLLGQYADK